VKFAATLSLFGLLSAPSFAAANVAGVPEESYGFLAVADGPCVPKIGAKLTPQQEDECQRLAEPRRYRGRWFVGFETSIFKPAGKPTCIEGVTLDYCPDLILEGKALPWPGRWSCTRMFEVDFVGRRTVWPGSGMNYRLIVDRLISAKRLPDPTWATGECDPKSP
jgi:hypothetical protein